MQSHGGQVRHLADMPRWGDDVTDFASPARFARRPRLKAAVLGRSDESGLPAITPSNAGREPVERLWFFAFPGRICIFFFNILAPQTAGGDPLFPLPAS